MTEVIPLGLSRDERKVLGSFLVEKEYNGNPIPFQVAKGIVRDLKMDRKRQACFRLSSKKAMDNYERAGKWSVYELRVKKLLTFLGLKEKKDYLHNYKLQNSEQTAYFSLDFFFPILKLNLEPGGDVWHGVIGDTGLKDIRRDKWVNKLGIRVARLTSKHFDLDDKPLLKLIMKCLYDSPFQEPDITCVRCRVDLPKRFCYCPFCGSKVYKEA